jgi:DNA-directed RNA polymerase subunit K/omega
VLQVSVAHPGGAVVSRPVEMNQFEFAIVSGLRAAQLMRGCVPRVTKEHKHITTAQREVAAGMVVGTMKAAPIKTGKLRLSDLVRMDGQ